MSVFEFDAELSSCGDSEPFALGVIEYDMLPEFKDGYIILIDLDGCV